MQKVEQLFLPSLTSTVQGPGKSHLWGQMGGVGDCPISVVSLDWFGDHLHCHSWTEPAGMLDKNNTLHGSLQSPLCITTEETSRYGMLLCRA
jgi:hypothetical protein